MTNGTRTIVIGGGISGLSAARTLEEIKRDYVLLERCPTIGGLTRTVKVGEFCFDYTGHFLHLSRYPTPADIPYASLDNEDWIKVDRRSCCLIGGKLVSAPIQYNLAELPAPLFAQCVESYEGRGSHSQHENGSFRDYIVNGFGERLAEIFLIPQNEKTMVVPLEQLSTSAIKRFFPAPDEALVRKGIENTSGNGVGYNARFWYPKVGGIDQLVKGISRGIKNGIVNQDVIEMDLRDRTVVTSSGASYQWDVLFSSMPLKHLCEVSRDEELIAMGAELSHSSTISFNIGLRGPLPTFLRDIHWIYVPDREIPFYRVGFYSNISRGTCTAGHSGVYAEVGVSPQELDSLDIMEAMQTGVLECLERLGWIRRANVVCVVAHIMRYAYVHHTRKRDQLVSSIQERLRKADVYTIGRYGSWDYTSMEDSMETARAAVLEV